MYLEVLVHVQTCSSDLTTDELNLVLLIVLVARQMILFLKKKSTKFKFSRYFINLA